MDSVAAEKVIADQGDSGGGKRTPLFRSPARLLLLMAAAIFISEVFIMLVLERIPQVPQSIKPLIDSTVLIIALSPTFYFLWFRPFMHQILESRRTEAEVRHLSRQLLHTGEVQAKKLAQDLHDEFGQAMTALQLDLESLHSVCPRNGEFCRETQEKILEGARALADRVRNFVSALRPQMLDYMGIVPTLEWHIREFFGNRGGLQVEFHTAGLKRRLPAAIEIVLYRICQEGLNNIVKHAHARNVGIWLTYSHPQILLTIRDDGRGFDPAHKGRGIGLLGMRERVASVGGSLHVVSESGKGTMLRVELPVTMWKEDEDDSRPGC